jgi:hypothetical protein
MNEEKSALQQIEEALKEFWRDHGDAKVIAARHTEFVVEPKVFIGDKFNPEILKLIVLNYLANSTVQDSGTGARIEIEQEKLIIKTPKGKPLVVVQDQNIIQQYLAMKQQQSQSE